LQAEELVDIKSEFFGENYPQPSLRMKQDQVSIAIIDDEVDLCIVLSGILKNQGYVVNYFNTIQEGFLGIKKMQPDWLILDNNLPDGLGWNKVDEILELVPNVNIIKISANPDSPRERHRDFIHYLIKPINVSSIIRLVSQTN